MAAIGLNFSPSIFESIAPWFAPFVGRGSFCKQPQQESGHGRSLFRTECGAECKHLVRLPHWLVCFENAHSDLIAENIKLHKNTNKYKSYGFGPQQSTGGYLPPGVLGAAATIAGSDRLFSTAA